MYVIFFQIKKMSTSHINYGLENKQFAQQYQWTNHVIEYKSHSFTRSAYDKYNKRKVKVKCYFNHLSSHPKPQVGTFYFSSSKFF